ncbi:MAG: bifunctional DNA primase/polymerase [Bryobacterales bacterium]|nr:bifunctional DNA primase/polymerase [Bryobacterales bacterium]
MAGNLEQALMYASQGYRVFPLFYVLRNGTCSCRARKPCNRNGKHPMTRNGVQDATTDEAQIRQWWTETPWANIGLATGWDGLIVMDVDDAGEKTGSETLRALLERHEPLPDTREVVTGSGGRHLYFYSTHEITNSAGKVGKYIDIRGYGGYVILPPSNHVSGQKYQWVNDLKPADMPPWLENLAMGSKINLRADSEADEREDVKDAREKDKTNRLTGDQLIRLLEYIPPDCDRDTWWQVGAVLKKELGDKRGFEAWDAWSKKAANKYDPKVMPVQWNSFTDQGLTAGTLHHFAKTLGDFRGFDIEAADAREFRDEWCFVAGIKRFVRLSTLTEWDKEQFDAMHAPMFNRGKPSEHVLKNPNFRRVEDATYWPKEPIWLTEDGKPKLNYWRPHDLTPAPGDVGPFLRHIQYLFPDGMEGKILLQYLAHQVQRPGEKVHWAVLIEGVQGNGKSYFAEVMRRVLGPRNVRMVKNETLHETFTGWQRNTQLIVVEEMMARQRLELMNKLKPMITEPWCQIREMYRPPYDQPNRFNFLFFSNHSDSIIIDSTDRRYCILKTKSPAHPDGNAYYGPLFDWTRKNAGPLLDYLLKVDLSKFQAKAHAPMTEGKRDLVMQSMMPLDAFIHERVEMEEHPFDADLVSPSLLVEPLAKYNLKCTPKDIGNAFQRLGYLNFGQMRNGFDRIYLWCVRNFDTYKDLKADQLRRICNNQNNGVKAEPSAEDEERLAKSIRNRTPVNPVQDREPM